MDTRGKAWKRILGAFTVAVLVLAAAPAEPRAEETLCGSYDGNVCQKNESCIWILFYRQCTTTYRYYPSGGAVIV
jgi:hypothetical protein